MVVGGVAALAMVVAATGGTGLAAPAAVSAPQPSDPGGPIMLGVAGGQLPTNNTTRRDAFETKAGRRMAVVRMYGLWDSTFPDVLSSSAKANGQTVLLSVKGKTSKNAAVPWATVANARPLPQGATPDARSKAYDQMVKWADQIKAFQAPIFFSFNHEPEESSNDRDGTPADFIAAWRRIVTVFRDQHVSNVEYTFIATAYGYSRTGARAAKNYYPGDDYVDDIAADGYNWYTCRASVKNAWASPTKIFGGFKAFGDQHPQKGMVIAEFGSVEDPAVPGRKAQWFTDMQNMLKQPGYGQFRVAAEWYPQGGGCNFTIDSSPSSLDAFRAFGADSTYAPMSVAPAIPRQLAVTKQDADTAHLTWQPAGPGGATVTGYTVHVVETGESFPVDPADPPSFTYTAGSPGTYTFTVTATNAAGEGRATSPTAALALG
jgi:hypothetical protein